MRFLAVPALALMALTIAPADGFRCRQSGDFCDSTRPPDQPAAAKKQDADCRRDQVRHTDGCCWTPKSIMALPPPEYDKPWEGTLIERVVEDFNELALRCAGHEKEAKAGHILGCSQHYGSTCIISIMPEDMLKQRGFMIEAVRRHEIAHCHGWKHP